MDDILMPQTPPRFDGEVFKTLLIRRELQCNEEELRQLLQEVNATQNSTQQQKFDLVVQKLMRGKVSTGQTAWSQFNTKLLPALVFWEGAWCYIEESTNENGYLLLVPGEPIREVIIKKEDMPVTVVLWLKAGKNQSQQQVAQQGADQGDSPTNVAWAWLKTRLLKERGWIVDVALASLMINFIAIVTSLFAMQVYDRVIPTLAYSTLYALVVGMFVISTIDWLLKLVRAKVLDELSCRVDQLMSQDIFEHIVRLQLDVMPRSLGTMTSQVNGFEAARQFFSSTVIFAIVDLPFALLSLGLIGVIGGHIGWVYSGLLLISLAIAYFTQRRIQNLTKMQMTRSNERTGILVDTLKGSESIRSAGAGWRFAKEWKDITSTISTYNKKQKSITNWTTTTSATLGSLAYSVAVVVGVHQIEAGNLTMGSLVACSILGGRVLGPIGQAVYYLVQWESVSQSMKMLDQILRLKTERGSDQTLLSPDIPPNKVDVIGVSYSYTDSPVKQVNVKDLTISAGERVALLGTVGSGKSTLLRIIAGLFKPTEGRIRIGEVDLWELDPTYVAKHISYLPQAVELFKGTLRSNVLLAGEVSDTIFLETIKVLGLDKVAAANEKGIDLVIAEGGAGLSGGQRQLVGLARVVINHPTIWLLDEPTSSLDVNSQKQVVEVLKNSLGPEDILIIATHNPQLATEISTRIIVMEGGEVVHDVATSQVELQKAAK